MNLDDVKNFLNQYETCVLATVDGTQPQAATVGYSVDDDFKILIATNVATRKAKNLISNSRVALVVGFEGTTTLQLEGSVRQLDTEESSDRLALHFEKVPGAKKHLSETGQGYFLITPTWLKFTDYTKTPNTFETGEFS